MLSATDSMVGATALRAIVEDFVRKHVLRIYTDLTASIDANAIEGTQISVNQQTGGAFVNLGIWGNTV